MWKTSQSNTAYVALELDEFFFSFLTFYSLMLCKLGTFTTWVEKFCQFHVILKVIADFFGKMSKKVYFLISLKWMLTDMPLYFFSRTSFGE